jgi:DNA-binding response OmpR family regulator
LSSGDDGKWSSQERRTSGVRARAQLRVLLVEPDIATRQALDRDAPDHAVRFLMTATVQEAATAREKQIVDVVVCSFPIPGADLFVRGLRRERFPVIVLTTEVARAVDVFGLRVPVLRKPLALVQLVRQATEMVAADARAQAVGALRARPTGTVVEVPARPNPKDPRRE